MIADEAGINTVYGKEEKYSKEDPNTETRNNADYGKYVKIHQISNQYRDKINARYGKQETVQLLT